MSTPTLTSLTYSLLPIKDRQAGEPVDRSHYDSVDEEGDVCPTPPRGRDKSGPYALGIASLALFGNSPTASTIHYHCRPGEGKFRQWGMHPVLVSPWE